MDLDAFDRFTRVLASDSSRRSVIGVLLGGSLAGAAGVADARKNNRKAKARKKNRRARTVFIEAADCLNPGPSSNMNGCNFTNDDFVGADLSSSSMRGTRFRGANLTCADLSSSQLKDADFRGFALPGNATNLTLADLSSSGCIGTRFNDRTLFCGTIGCDGTVRNDDCPGGPPAGACCAAADCGFSANCVENACECTIDPGVCLIPGSCGDSDTCALFAPADGGGCFCGEVVACEDLESCDSAEDCPDGWACGGCCHESGPLCVPPCGVTP